MRSATCLSPRDAKLLVRYLDGVDDVVTTRLSSGFSPHEDHLTALLCEMLDDNFAVLNALPYPLTTLREDLALDAKGLAVSLTIEARKYPPNIESKMTSADLGVVVVYVDNILPASSFERAALFQAKKLYCSSPDGTYTLADSFTEFDPEQLSRLSRVEEENCGDKDRRPPGDLPYAHPYAVDHCLCHYLFYCPRPEAYDHLSQEELQRYLILGGHIFDYAVGLHLYELASDPARHVPGLLVSEIDWLVAEYLAASASRVTSVRRPRRRPTARDVFGRLWRKVTPFSWFIVYNMLMAGGGCSDGRAIGLVRGERLDVDTLILPRYVLTLRVQLGTHRG